MLRLTPAVLEAAYEFLRATPPFSRWGLPHADEIEFHVTRDPHRVAHFIDKPVGRGKRQWIIGISERGVGLTYTLLGAMAHEMVHLAQTVRGTAPKKPGHNREFRSLAAKVCRVHGFDPKEF